MKIQLLVIVAPFGFGPAAKALILANGLQGSADVTFCADQDAFDFIDQYKHPAHTNLQGMFGRLFPHASSLDRFDYFVSINHAPALQVLERYGLADRTIFFDSLLSWRASHAQTMIPSNLLAYLVQDYPGVKQLLDKGPNNTTITAPVIWPIGEQVERKDRRGILLHLGGLTSPLAAWDAIAETVLRVVASVAQLARHYRMHLTLVGSAHLNKLPPKDGLTILGSMDPKANVRLISQSALLVTTPGIGAIYEAMTHDTPVLLLPPMNSTQLHHYQLLRGQGIAGAIPDNAARQLVEKAKTLNWEQQTRLCLGVLKAQPRLLLAELPDVFAQFLDDDPPLESQRRLFASFSKTSAVMLIEKLILPLGRNLNSRPSVREAASSETDDVARTRLKVYLQALPKAELHLHLEGAIRPELLLKMAARNKLNLPFSTPQQFYKFCVFNSFKDFSNVLLMGVYCLRQLEDFFDVVVDMGRNLAAENVRYAEITWTPQFYLNRGFALDNILAAMNQGRDLVKKQLGVDIRWLPDLVRSYPKPAAIVARWLTNLKLQQHGVVAMGLAGPEMGHPASGFSAVFARAKVAGLPANPHAGEGMGPESVWETLRELNPSRLGHGVRAVEDKALITHLVQQDIPLEVCLSSNVKLGLYSSYAEHPLRQLLAAGCRVTLNTDDPVLFQTTLSQEYLHAIENCGLDTAALQQLIVGAVEASYLPSDEKQDYIQSFRNDFGKFDKIYMGNQQDSKSIVVDIKQESQPAELINFNPRRCINNPIITPEMLPGSDGANINGPSLIEAPSWLPNRLGRFYLYFAHHQGSYIRLAYADELEGPWHIYKPGTLNLTQTPGCCDHIASPDVHVDHEQREIRMYFHGVVASKPRQRTFVARSSDGINFQGSPDPIADFYLKARPWRNYWFGMSKGGVLYLSDNGGHLFKQLLKPAFPMRHPRANAPGDVRHVALRVVADSLQVFFTRIGDAPEAILMAEMDLSRPMFEWQAVNMRLLLKPEMAWEGADLLLSPSKFGASPGLENALRDPDVFDADGKTYLLYSVAGEAGIALAELGDAVD